MSNDVALPDKTGEEQGTAAADNTVRKQRGALPERVKIPSVKQEDGRLLIEATKADHAAIDAALGSGSADFQAYAIAQLLNILPSKQQPEDYAFHLNSALAMVAAIDPRDELEAMLAAQMVAAHHAAMEMTGYCVRTDRLDSKPMYGNLATKFSRTFAAQLEALNRHRRGGKQIVEHVHVNAGGQAVIAETVNTGGRG